MEELSSGPARTAASKPSATKSTTRSLRSISSSISGYASTKSTASGATTSLPTARGRVDGADLSVELLDLLENGMGAREVARACLGRADVARGPAQQRDAQH